MRRHSWSLGTIALGSACLSLAAVAMFTFAGIYDIGADQPHSRLTSWWLATIRQRSIEVHAARLAVPRLDNATMVAHGAAHYDAMCVECHLAPGVLESELRTGLYPKPPELSKSAVPPAQAFWVIKHGIKMTGMPAWGKTHDDETVWSIVAFLKVLPTLNPDTYRALRNPARGSDTGENAHTLHHHGDDSSDHGAEEVRHHEQ